jgi:hypothetical protein
MKKKQFWFGSLLVVIMLAAATACTPGAVEQTTIEQTSPDPQDMPTTGIAPDEGDLGVPMEVVSGQVTIELSSILYAKGQAIGVTIANGLEQTIYTNDMKSACTIAILEKKVDDKWVPLIGCGMERLPLAVAIGPGMGRTVTVDPDDPIFDGTRPDQGTYRIRFTYKLVPEKDADEPLESISAEFTIGS